MEGKQIVRNEIDSLFENLNKNQISYCVLRGYLSDSDFYEGTDIDIFLDKKDRKAFEKLIFSLGYKTPRINDNIYPHKQYFKLIPGKLLKLDVVTSIRYGSDLMRLGRPINLEKDSTEYKNIRVLNPEISFRLFLLHLILDKQMVLSKHNAERLETFKSIAGASEENKLLLEILSLRKDLNESKHVLIEKCFIKKGHYLCFHRLKRRINYYRFRLNKKKRNKKICFLGIDGSGKSSSLKFILESYDGRLVSKYMGFHSMETKWGKKYLSKEKISPKIKRFFYIRREMLYRLKNIDDNEYRPILLDRYPWEATLNNRGKYKIIYWFLFNVFFPRPKLGFYFYCDEETSLKRKDDIENIDLFRANKKKADSKYLKKKRIIPVNTDKCSYDDILLIFCNVMMKTNLYELMI